MCLAISEGSRWNGRLRKGRNDIGARTDHLRTLKCDNVSVLAKWSDHPRAPGVLYAPCRARRHQRILVLSIFWEWR